MDSIRPFLPARRRLSLPPALLWCLAAVALLALLATGLKGYWPGASAPPPTETALDLTGRWTAQIKYDWGAMHEETFVLKQENKEVHGTDSYLRVARTVEQGQVQADRLSFITHSQEVLGDASRELTHRYCGQLKAGELHFVLETSGGDSSHTPVEFIARRASN